MGWFEATLIFMVGMIAIAILIPAANELVPFISNSMGGTVAGLVSSMLIIIIAAAIMLYIRGSLGQENYYEGPVSEYG